MRRARLAALSLLALGLAATLWVRPFSDERVSDLFVYRVFAEGVLSGGIPYRDEFLEYPPLAAAAIALPGVVGTGEEAFRLAYGGWALLLGAVVVLLCGSLAAHSGGDPRRAMIAAALAPLLLGALLRTHFDLAPVALTLAALLLLLRNRPRAGMAVLGLAVMTKGFPLVAAPPALVWLWRAGRPRDAAEGGFALAAVCLILALAAVVASPHGAHDALRYQLDRPVQVESIPATVLVTLDELGAAAPEAVASHRSDGLEHSAAGPLSGVLAALLAAFVVLLAIEAGERPVDPRRLVLAALVAVAAFACLGRVLSPQYLVWMVPLGALALAWRYHALAVAVALAAVLTQLEFPAHYADVVGREPVALALVAARNSALLVALALALRALEARRQQQLLDRGGAPVVAGVD